MEITEVVLEIAKTLRVNHLFYLTNYILTTDKIQCSVFLHVNREQ